MSELLKKDLNEKGTLTLTLNRPDVHNAFNDEVIQLLTLTFKEIENDSRVLRVVLTGAGKSFCSGADLNWMKSMINYSFEENVHDSKALAQMFETINSCEIPVIGLVNGHALGGGVGLLAVCDYVLAVENAKIGFTEVNLGLIPAVISPYCMQKIGISWARALFLSGEVFNATKAYDIGLVHKVVQNEEFNSECEKLIQKFESLPHSAVFSAKVLINQVGHLSTEMIQDFTCEAIANQRISKNGQEGMSALLEKRKPNWIQNDK
ncbi:MAG: enoyl-CoA hydratase [Halobacteriovoraceae bacterium]|nr:enoyl-CoA hydratase [Halobacteriovoraceae bacterium]|tara:strand:- start:15069 stop:15860 length:792 start_codon:yes stop_codon:yes gene_type:complete